MAQISKNQVKWVRSLQQKKNRDAEGVFVAEGRKCVQEMLRYFEPVLLIDEQNADATALEQMSSLRTPQGQIGVFRRPQPSPIPLPSDSGLLLALDGVQDPGNLGTIIRTADWFGVRDIVCSQDTADCWNPKVVQATMGALGRVRVHYTQLPDYLAEARGCAASVLQGVTPIYGTLLEGRNMYTNNAIPQKQNGIIVMGNEGNGLSPEVRNLVTHPLLIPSYPADAETSESLNVAIATAIVLAEFRR